MPTVSVIIPAYNSADFITDAIDSVLAQTYKDYEIIVVDDGSTDNIDEVVNSYDAPIKFIKQPNGGAAVARNTGMRNARGGYIAFLDADDIWLPSKLEMQIELLEKEKDLGMVCCDGFRWVPPAEPSEGGRLSVLRGRPPQRPTRDFMFKIHIINTSSVVFSRVLLEQIGDMDKALKHGQDFEFFLRLAAQRPVAYIDSPLMAYRVHSRSTSNLITGENVRRRLRTKIMQREVALKSVPKLKEYLTIRIYAHMPVFVKYIILLLWRIKYSGSKKYLLSCLFRYGRKLLFFSR